MTTHVKCYIFRFYINPVLLAMHSLHWDVCYRTHCLNISCRTSAVPMLDVVYR